MEVPQPIPPHPRQGAGQDLLETWDEIAVYLDRDPRTVKRWERSRGLPVHRLPDDPKSVVYAVRSELERWRTGALPGFETAGHPGGRRRWWLYLAFSFLGAVLLIFAWGLRAPKTPAPQPQRVPLTSYPGTAWFPAFSPDGRQIAFSWNGEHEDNHDIFVKPVTEGSPVRITSHPAMDLAPAWSPDGRLLAFFRWVRGASKIEFLVVPALGGAERRIAQGTIVPNAIGIPFPVLAWTPDGRRVIKGSPEGLEVIAIETGESQHITEPPSRSPGDCCPAVSPDGRSLAFLRASSERTRSPMVVDIAPNGEPDGAPKPMPAPSCENPIWSGDSSELFCIAVSGEGRALWRIPVRRKGIPLPVPSIGAVGQHLAISPRGDRIVFSNLSPDSNWLVPAAKRRSGDLVLVEHFR
jgi:Tol biopolymer transport system component